MSATTAAVVGVKALELAIIGFSVWEHYLNQPAGVMPLSEQIEDLKQRFYARELTPAEADAELVRLISEANLYRREGVARIRQGLQWEEDGGSGK